MFKAILFCFKHLTSKSFFVVAFCIIMTKPLQLASKNKKSTPVINSKYNCAPSSSELTISPLRSGYWRNTAIWPSGVLPSLNENVIIPEGVTVTLIGDC